MGCVYNIYPVARPILIAAVRSNGITVLVANVLKFSKRVAVIHALCEGTSIRATARLCKVDKDVVMRLGNTVGEGCAKLHDRMMRGVRPAYIEVDECWAFVFCKQKTKIRKKSKIVGHGDAYTMFAIDNETKLVPSYITATRSMVTATKVMKDLRARTVGKYQMSVDGWPDWIEAVRRAFGHNGVHLGQTVKEYQRKKDTSTPERKYSPSRVKTITRTKVFGEPEEEMISTAKAEQKNLDTRMRTRRLTRLTNAFSKKARNLRAALHMHFFHYNFVREHGAHGTAPAVQAKLIKRPWTLEEMVTAALEAAGEKAETRPKMAA